jgi:glycine dehydrogenase subunit 1
VSYLSLSRKDKKEMLKAIGVSSVDSLFDSIPDTIRLRKPLDLPPKMSEPELLNYFTELTRQNNFCDYVSFIGAGAYSHFIPAVVDYLSSRGEFVSPYTPYQPEVSQGTLQMIFEFQTMMAQLTGMDISNASLYDGATGTAEAVLMANRINRKSKVILAGSLHPHYRHVIQTYTKNLGFTLIEINWDSTGRIDPDKLAGHMDEEVTAVVCQSPNFFGVIEDLGALADLAHKYKSLFIVSVAEAMSLGLLEPPGKFGADIVTGEAQSFGIPLSFGGPLLGFMTCKKDFIRQFPGRIAGQTHDVDGNRGFVLTLSTREQHIRRERATSNICTNQALCMVRAAIYLEKMGKQGIQETARQNIHKSRYAFSKLTGIDGVNAKFSGPVFNEFVLEFEHSWKDLERRLHENGLLAGLELSPYYPELENCALVCVTETHSKDMIERFAETVETAIRAKG